MSNIITPTTPSPPISPRCITTCVTAQDSVPPTEPAVSKSTPVLTAKAAASAKRTSEGEVVPYGPSAWTPGLIHRLHSPDELKEFLREYQDRLVVMVCKAKGCRPCRAFQRKYMRCAEDYKEVVFLEIFGDETVETRKLMMALQVKSTPTFMLFRDKGPVHTHSGINENKLRNALNVQTGLSADLDETEED